MMIFMNEKPLQNQPEIERQEAEPEKQNPILRLVETLAHLGLGEASLRIGTNVLTLLVVLAVVLLMQTLYRQSSLGWMPVAEESPAATVNPDLVDLTIPQVEPVSVAGIGRDAMPHTIIPSRPRLDVLVYTVQEGDSVFGIAEKFGLQPSTILFGNYDVLKDSPHSLRPGQELYILPVDGTYYKWFGAESLIKVAETFGVDPEVIVNYPGNHLDPDTIGDLSQPNIAANTWLIVPGGTRPFTSWTAPVGMTRSSPATTRVLGLGSCGAVNGGQIGFGTFIWPSPKHWLSGTPYRPDINHRAIDLAAQLGDAAYATDAGVVVYAGWNDWGYGNLIVLDHGNGWQSLYAHLNGINVSCGQNVGQGDIIGLIGSTGNSTGPHLHFELTNTTYGYVNPLDFLPAP
jgi:murein DD-endopeptidase MepM/ murein hydrolase activator NlpD